MEFNFSFLIMLLVMISCSNQPRRKVAAKIGADFTRIDSIKNASDSNYSRRYPAGEFERAEYFINSADSTVLQLMKDSSDSIRQVIITRNDNRVYFARYYSNGQLVAFYNLDLFGQYDGESVEYYENGVIQSEGVYRNGLRTGSWKTFDENGNYKTTSNYNKDGQQEKIIKENIDN